MRVIIILTFLIIPLANTLCQSKEKNKLVKLSGSASCFTSIYHTSDCSGDLNTLDDDLDNNGFLGANGCNDNNASVNPSVLEILNNAIDDDCNPAITDDDLDNE